MSDRGEQWAWGLQVGPTAKIVAYWLGRHEVGGTTDITMARVARLSGLSVRACQRGAAALMDSGHIESWWRGRYRLLETTLVTPEATVLTLRRNDASDALGDENDASHARAGTPLSSSSLPKPWHFVINEKPWPKGQQLSPEQCRRYEGKAHELGLDIYEVACEFVDYWQAPTVGFRAKWALGATFSRRLNDLAKYAREEGRNGRSPGPRATGPPRSGAGLGIPYPNVKPGFDPFAESSRAS